jgi:MFS family permease
VPTPYRAVFAAPGTKAFFFSGFVGRMPRSMLGIGIVTMMSQVTGRYELAGALSATLALASAALCPQVSRLVDRYGQRRVLRPVSAVTVLAVGALVVCVWAKAPDWALFACAAVAGGTPSLGTMARARWSLIHRGTPLLHAAYSLESVADELVFVAGPVLSIGLCTMLFPEAGPLLAGLFLLMGTYALTAQRSTEPSPHPRGHHDGGGALRSAGLRVLVATFAAIGTVFGAVEVATVAFAEEQGHKAAASLVLAAYASGSCLTGFAFGLLRPTIAASHRFLLGACAMALSMIPLLLVGNLPFLTMVLFLSGLSIAPTMVTAMALVEQLVPRAKLTEGLTWTSTGLTLGTAVGASLSGAVTDASGARPAFAVPAVAAAAAAAVAVLGYRRLHEPAPELKVEGSREHGQRQEQDQHGGHVA